MAELVRKNRDQDTDFYFASLKIVAKKALTKIMFSTTVVKIPKQGTVTRHQFDEASKETQKQKRLNSEYKSVIQKQSKLIEILRNKCTHLEAARVLEFTEEEFLRALDWQK